MLCIYIQNDFEGVTIYFIVFIYYRQNDVESPIFIDRIINRKTHKFSQNCRKQNRGQQTVLKKRRPDAYVSIICSFFNETFSVYIQWGWCRIVFNCPTITLTDTIFVLAFWVHRRTDLFVSLILERHDSNCLFQTLILIARFSSTSSAVVAWRVGLVINIQSLSDRLSGPNVYLTKRIHVYHLLTSKSFVTEPTPVRQNTSIFTTGHNYNMNRVVLSHITSKDCSSN